MLNVACIKGFNQEMAGRRDRNIAPCWRRRYNCWLLNNATFQEITWKYLKAPGWSEALADEMREPGKNTQSACQA